MSQLQMSDVKVKLNSKSKKESNTAIFQLGPIHLNIASGEINVILGPSGCGKSTLLRTIAGLVPLESGTISADHIDISHTLPEQRGIGMVFQNSLLFPHMTVEENVAFGLKMQGIDKESRIKKADEWLDTVGLKGFGNRRPNELSGGQQQRVALARAFAMKPKLILLDEPFSALDPNLRKEMGQLLLHLQKQFSMTVVFVTHDQDEAFHLANQIILMKDGMIQQVSTPRELYENPSDSWTAKFLGINNLWQGTLMNQIFTYQEFKLELQPERLTYLVQKQNNLITEQLRNTPKLTWLMLRPEAFQLLSPSDSITYPRLKGVVCQTQYLQGMISMQVKSKNMVIDVLEKSTLLNIPAIGESVILTYDIRLAWFMDK